MIRMKSAVCTDCIMDNFQEIHTPDHILDKELGCEMPINKTQEKTINNQKLKISRFFAQMDKNQKVMCPKGLCPRYPKPDTTPIKGNNYKAGCFADYEFSITDTKKPKQDLDIYPPDTCPFKVEHLK